MSTETIITGAGHLGNCPRCGYAIVQISRRPPEAPKYSHGVRIHVLESPGPVLAQCVNDHVLINPEIVMRWDAPSPIYPQPGASGNAL